MGGRYGSAAALCALGGGGTQRGPTNAGEGACHLGGAVAGPLGLLQLSGEVSGLPKKFESVTHREGEDPATFASELEILAVRGFGDMGARARTRMVRDRFILVQHSCGLRRYLDSVPPGTPIREIVDRCRVWESHSEQQRGLSPGAAAHRGHLVSDSDSWESAFFTKYSHMTVVVVVEDGRAGGPEVGNVTS